ncbi:MAG: L,D-transpeptidase [Anaerolineales bacterium]|nr:L,D-transpeptidase [Anaerolineales bacterium]
MVPASPFSRRDFLKVSGAGLLGLCLPAALAAPARAEDLLLGRVAESQVEVRSEPSSQAPVLHTCSRDSLLAVSEIVISADLQAYNRVWYRLGAEGYVFSGGVQPVATHLNTPVSDLPRGGQLAEMTVPFSDARRGPSPGSAVTYRMYYATTHWVMEAVEDREGQVYYKIYDDKWSTYSYLPAEHLRLIPPEELAPLAPEVPNAQKRIEVSLGEQIVYAYEGERMVFFARASSGFRVREGVYATPAGRFTTFRKRPSRHMAGTGYDLPGVPWVSYINDNGVSFHGTYWHNDYGRPRSHGCINLTPQAAKWLYLWTEPVLTPQTQSVYRPGTGTAVDIHV